MLMAPTSDTTGTRAIVMTIMLQNRFNCTNQSPIPRATKYGNIFFTPSQTIPTDYVNHWGHGMSTNTANEGHGTNIFTLLMQWCTSNLHKKVGIGTLFEALY